MGWASSRFQPARDFRTEIARLVAYPTDFVLRILDSGSLQSAYDFILIEITFVPSD